MPVATLLELAPRVVRKTRTVAGVLGLALAPTSVLAREALTSSAVDYSIYRPGEVQRVDRQFSAWQLSCDEIKRLSKKFCSLRGVARAADGTIVAALLISTDDSGRPAAILRLPLGTVLSSGVTLQRGGAQPKQSALGLSLRPSVCDRSGCQAIWSIAPDDVRSLTRNEAVTVSFKLTRPPLALAPLVDASVPIEGTIQTAGFAAALQASAQ